MLYFILYNICDCKSHSISGEVVEDNPIIIIPHTNGSLDTLDRHEKAIGTGIHDAISDFFIFQC